MFYIAYMHLTYGVPLKGTNKIDIDVEIKYLLEMKS